MLETWYCGVARTRADRVLLAEVGLGILDIAVEETFVEEEGKRQLGREG